MHVPAATYRLQFTPEFGFSRAREIVDYLAELGVSHVYASPIFKARAKSTHGYDLVDPLRLNPELGTDEDFQELAGEVRSRNMGWLQDIVPNHMAYHWENRMLEGVLRLGERSKYFGFFDIDWSHPGEDLNGKLLAPFLGRDFRECLEGEEIRLVFDETGLWAGYYDLKFPLTVESCLEVLTKGMDGLKARLGEGHPAFVELSGIVSSLENISGEKRGLEERLDALNGELFGLYTASPEIREYIEGNIAGFDSTTGGPDGPERLERLLSEQLFRLSFWKTAAKEINYRRFFSINHLICLGVEKKEVFRGTHSLISRLIDEKKITGLRVDHIDGLYDPKEYLERLRRLSEGAYTVVEKILERGEDLPDSWPVEGTTGYDFLNVLNGVFCDSSNEGALSRIYLEFTGFEGSYAELVADKKRLILEREMAADLDNLARAAKGLLSGLANDGDIDFHRLKKALGELLARFPVYRTYISRDTLSDADRGYLETALEDAKHAQPGLTRELDLLGGCLLALGEGMEHERLSFAMRFQQLTGPLMAKGFEDTTLYVFNRLISLNEVGGSPGALGVSLNEFHRFNAKRADSWPRSLSATSTHDTKRGEDVRARINVLSEIPGEWADCIQRWSGLNRARKKYVKGAAVPDANEEYLLYQTLVGAYPFEKSEVEGFPGRIKEYIVKAAREAKVHTSWFEPDREREEALVSFVHELLEPSGENAFLEDFFKFQKKIAHLGVFNSLSQTLVKAAAPGVPDFYQGTELWDLSLVDPDNRRAVDFQRRKEILQELVRASQGGPERLMEELLATREDGRVKLFLIHRALRARNEHKRLFERGGYLPLEMQGPLKRHVVAFARRLGAGWAAIAAPRLMARLINEGELPLGRGLWKDTAIVLPEGSPGLWKDAISGREVSARGRLDIGLAFRRFPGVLLMGAG